MFRTSNPTLRNPYFSGTGGQAAADVALLGGMQRGVSGAPARVNHMTMQGTVNKTAFLLALCVASALGGWTLVGNNPALLMPMWLVGSIGGLVLVLIACFKPTTSPIVAPLYAIAQGGFVGGISWVFAKSFAKPGGAMNTDLVFNAALLTFGILGGLLAAYSFRLIRPNKLFYNVVITGTIGAALYGLIAMVFGMFGNFSLASVYDPNNGGMVSVGFSVLLVVLASANLVLDFDQIEMGVRNQAPRHMEWFGGMSLLVTLVWLYIEVLRLLAKLRRD